MRTKNGIYSLLFGLLLMIVTSCSKDNDSVARELLATVPSNAAAVMLFDGEQMVEKAGGAKNVMTVLNNNVTNEARSIINTVSEVWTPTSVVMFMDGDNVYLTTRVDKPSDLIAAIEKQQGAKLAVDGDLTYNGHIAVAGDQVWVATGRSSLSSTSIKKYIDFSENQSFASVGYCDKMIESDDDVTGLLNVGSLINIASGGITKAAGAQMALSTLFDNAAYATINVKFEKGEADMEMKVLTSKFKTAKFLIPVSKVDTEVIKRVAAHAGSLIAVNIDSKIVGKIREAAKSFGGALPEEWLRILEPVDGTVVLAGEPTGSAMTGIVTTNGQSSLALSKFLAEMQFTTSTQGKDLLFSNGGQVEGSLDVAAVADRFKGSWAGVVTSAPAFSGMDGVISTADMMLHPADGGLRLDVKMWFADKKTNALVQLLKNTGNKANAK